jgi:hypothetical protein
VYQVPYRTCTCTTTIESRNTRQRNTRQHKATRGNARQHNAMEGNIAHSPHSIASTRVQRKLQLENYLNPPNSKSHKRSLVRNSGDASVSSQSRYSTSKSRCSTGSTATGKSRTRSNGRSRRTRNSTGNSVTSASTSTPTSADRKGSNRQYVTKRQRSVNERDTGKEDSSGTKSTDDDLSRSDTISEGDDGPKSLKSLSSTAYLRQRRSNSKEDDTSSSSPQETPHSAQADSKSSSSSPSQPSISGNGNPSVGSNSKKSSKQSSKQPKSPPKDSKWLEKRGKRQDAIMDKERLETELHNKKEEEVNRDIYQCNEGNPFDDYGLDSDAPIGIQQSRQRAAFKDVLSTVLKTAGKTKNVVVHPKRTAKNFAKTTVNAVRDPRKAAINVGKATKKVTVGTARVGAGLTIGVTKGTLGATKTVAKGTYKGTTKVVGGTLKGAGKVVKGTAHLITGGARSDHGNEDEAYDNSKLSERQTSSLMDRVNGMIDSSSSNDVSTNELADLKEHAAMLRRGDSSLSSEGRTSSRLRVLDRRTSLRENASIKKERKSLVSRNMDKFLLSMESEENKEIWDL